MSTLGTRLIDARKAAGLSQQELADRAGVTQSTIGNIEAGIRKQPRELLRIAGALGVRAAWLQTGDGPMRGADTPPPMPMEWPFELLTRERWALLTERQRGAAEAAAVAALQGIGAQDADPRRGEALARAVEGLPKTAQGRMVAQVLETVVRRLGPALSRDAELAAIEAVDNFVQQQVTRSSPSRTAPTGRSSDGRGKSTTSKRARAL